MIVNTMGHIQKLKNIHQHQLLESDLATFDKNGQDLTKIILTTLTLPRAVSQFAEILKNKPHRFIGVKLASVKVKLKIRTQ